MKRILLLSIFLLGCDVAANGEAEPLDEIQYEADFYTCGEPPIQKTASYDFMLFTCVVGTGPPRQDCVYNGDGHSVITPTLC